MSIWQLICLSQYWILIQSYDMVRIIVLSKLKPKENLASVSYSKLSIIKFADRMFEALITLSNQIINKKKGSVYKIE